MKVKDIAEIIEAFAPLSLQPDWDNSGLLVGDPQGEVTGVYLALDVTDRVLDAAVEAGCNLVVTHHPLIFFPLKHITESTPTERLTRRAIRENIAVYAAHMSLDCTRGGMSWFLAERLGVRELRALSDADGAGVIGEIEPQSAETFLDYVQRTLGLPCLRHSVLPKGEIRTVALCTGGADDRIGAARTAGADLYLTGDIRYHNFTFTATDPRPVIADIGHFESEVCAIDLLHEILSKKLHNFAIHKDTAENPVLYKKNL